MRTSSAYVFSCQRQVSRISAALVIFTTLFSFVPPGGVAIAADDAASGSFSNPPGTYVWQTAETGALGGFSDQNIFAGYQFSPNKEGVISELCGFFTGTHFVSLYDKSFRLLASASISSYERWNCAVITPVAVSKGQLYYAAAEIVGGPAYFRSQSTDLLPATAGGVTIKLGVSQKIDAAFGKNLKTYTYLVPGMVDIKFLAQDNAVDFAKKSGASLSAAVSGKIQNSATTTPAVQWNDVELLRNCASGKCIVCGSGGCKISDDKDTASQKEATFIQTCSKGICYSCTSGNCGKTDASGIVKSGYSFKNCADNKCLNCVNSECKVTGGDIPKYNYQYDAFSYLSGGVDYSLNVVSNWNSGNVSYDSLPCIDCGGGGNYYGDYGLSNGMTYTGGFTGGGVSPEMRELIAKQGEIKTVFQSPYVGLDATWLKDAWGSRAKQSLTTPITTPKQAVATGANQYTNKQVISIGTKPGQVNSPTGAVANNPGVTQTSNGRAVVQLGGQQNYTGQTPPVNLSGAAGLAALNTGALYDINGNYIGQAQATAYVKDLNGNLVAAKSADGKTFVTPYFDAQGNPIGTAIGEDVNTRLTSLVRPGDTKIAPVVASKTTIADRDYAAGATIQVPEILVNPEGKVVYEGTIAYKTPEAIKRGDAIVTPVKEIPYAKDMLDANEGYFGYGPNHGAGDVPVATIVHQNAATAGAQTGGVVINQDASRSNYTMANGAIAAPVTVNGVLGYQPVNGGSIFTQQPVTGIQQIAYQGSDGNNVYLSPAATVQGSDGNSYYQYNAPDNQSYYQPVNGGSVMGSNGQTISAASADESGNWLPCGLNSLSTNIYTAQQSSTPIYNAAGQSITTITFTPVGTTGDNSSFGSTYGLTGYTPNSLDNSAYIANNGGAFQANDGATYVYDAELRQAFRCTGGDCEGRTRVLDQKATDYYNSFSGPTVDATSPYACAVMVGGQYDPTFLNAEISGNTPEENLGNGEAQTGWEPITGTPAVTTGGGQNCHGSADGTMVCDQASADSSNKNVAGISLEAKFASLFVKNAQANLSCSLLSMAGALTGKDTAKASNVTFTNPVAGPKISNLEPGMTNGKDVTISVQTDIKASCRYSPYDLPYAFMWYGFETKDGLKHEYKIGDLGDGNYLYFVRCQDEAGNANLNSQPLTFGARSSYDAKSENDTKAPEIPAVKISQASIQRGTMQTIASTVKDNVKAVKATAQLRSADGKYRAVVALADDGANGDGKADDGVWGYRWDSTGKSGGEYQVTVVAIDSAGNFAQAENAARFTVAGDKTGGSSANYCKALANNGPSDKKVDVVFAGCGYGKDMEAFAADAKKQIDQFSKFAPLSDDIAKFNFTAAQLPGMTCEESWQDNMEIDAIRFKQLAAACNPDILVVVKKTSQPGGGISFGGAGIAFVAADSPTAAVHEIGHAFFNLNDEYSYGCTATDMRMSPNCDNDVKCSKWKGVDGAGCYAGCTCEGNYRSSNDCVMLDAAAATGFCPVCTRQIEAIMSTFE